MTDSERHNLLTRLCERSRSLSVSLFKRRREDADLLFDAARAIADEARDSDALRRRITRARSALDT